MWRDPMDELIADLETVVEATPPQFNDQTPSIVDIQHFIARDLRRADAWDGTDPDAVDPTYRGGVRGVSGALAQDLQAGQA